MPDNQQSIIEQIAAHAAMINELTKKLRKPETTKKGRGVTPEMMAKYDARTKKSMYR